MDLLTNAALLGTFAYGGTFLVLVVLASIFTGGDQDRLPAWAKVLVVLGIAYAAVFLIASSSWASETEIAGRTLSDASVWDLIVVGFLVTLFESATFLGLEKVLANVGVPMPTATQKKALDLGAENYAKAHLPAGGGSHPDALEALPADLTPKG